MKKRKILFIIPFFLIFGIITYYISISSHQEGLFSNNENKTAGFDKPEGYLEYYHQITVPFGEKESGYLPNYAFKELQKAKKREIAKKSSKDVLPWVMRGPGNVGGRTRSIIIDPDDPSGNTWLAGTASGGIWKTTDAGENWTDIAPDLPNLAAVELSLAPSNTNKIYAGTGEGYGGVGMVTGNGIFVSSDKGQTWNIIPSTEGNLKFSYVNRIWIDPVDENILIVATNTGIYKSSDGGNNWSVKYESGYKVQDLYQNPQNSNVLYAGVNTKGVYKSTNKGETWVAKNNGFGGGRRYEIAVSNVDTSYVFAVVENPLAKMDVYLSQDGGEIWRRQVDATGIFYNFHSAQGWYNSVVEPHPFNANEVYVAGVYIGKVAFGTETSESSPLIINVDTVGTSDFLDFVPFNDDYDGWDGMKTGIAEKAKVDEADFTSVEIRFGPGKSQKAHRFLVPDGEGPGVPYVDYAYQDYVVVPFEVWDTDNNIQLMASFRDQERDGNFNLIVRDPDDEVQGREYIYVQAIPYDAENPSSLIAKDGGHFEKLLYFFWPTLAPGGTWDIESLPESKLFVNYGTLPLQKVGTSMIHGPELNTNLHVDHHDLAIIPGATASDPIRMIVANDGGVGYSANGGNTWEQMDNGFFTTQFYGVAKKPGVHEYIGGLQDNGTWQSPSGEEALSTSNYNYRVGGDGFEVLWHNTSTKLILASIYNNNFRRSSDGGVTWSAASDGINSDGPFLSKLSNSRENPNLVFAVGSGGVWRHTLFGKSNINWTLISIGDGWTINETAYSSHQVEVSLADKNVVWAGAGMFESPKLNLFLSKDMGLTFNAVKNYTGSDMGFCSGLATHPVDPETAYLLFSYRADPKVLRTTDFGETWEDISGFESNEESSNGFPDVTVNDLLVMPYNSDILWAATEIGIFESLDNGASWHYADNGLPAVSVFQLQFQDGAIIAATHGRGIWTTEGLPQSVKTFRQIKENINVYPNPVSAQINYSFFVGNSSEGIVNVYDLNGEKVLSQNIELFQNEKNVKHMDVSGLPSGIYILEISDNERVYNSRFIKN